MAKEIYTDKARGMLVGLAVGDALGAPVEFLPGPSNVYIKEMGDKIRHFHENYRAPKGVYTDDTEMALCITDSLLVNEGYDSYDIMRRFHAWSEEGYRTYDDKPAHDVGLQTARAINEFMRHPLVAKNHPKTESAGNGPIMRLAPIVLASISPNKEYKNTQDIVTDADLTNLTELAVLSCRETHDSYAAEVVAEMFSIALFTAMYAKGKSDVKFFAEKYFELKGQEYEEFKEKYKHLLIDRARYADAEDLYDLGGYIVDTFAIALWGFLHSDTFEEGMIRVIRLGGDTDTNAACYGQLAGAYYGYKNIPKEWREEVFKGDELVELADKLYAMKKCPILRTRFEDNEHFEVPEDISKSIINSKETEEPSEAKSLSELLKERFNNKEDLE